METQVSVVSELQDFFRRRAEVELDYSKNLDKLSKTLQLRHKEQKQKWVTHSNFEFYSVFVFFLTRAYLHFFWKVVSARYI